MSTTTVQRNGKTVDAEVAVSALGPPAAHVRDDGGAGDELRALNLVRTSRRLAVWLTIGIATVSFVLSFASLRDLAAMSAWPGWLSWLWPLIIDGTIVLATLGIVALAPYRDQLRNRAFFWAVLTAAALVSVGGNALHAWLATDHLVAWLRWGSAALACVPPVALLATTHSLAILWRFTPTPPPERASKAQVAAAAVAAAQGDKWVAVAAAIHDLGALNNQPTSTIAEILRLLYDHRPPMKLRAIGREVGVHHDTVARVRDAAEVVLADPPKLLRVGRRETAGGADSVKPDTAARE